MDRTEIKMKTQVGLIDTSPCILKKWNCSNVRINMLPLTLSG